MKKAKRDSFSLFLMAQLGLMTGQSLCIVATSLTTDELSLQEFMSYPTYEARSYVPYEHANDCYFTQDLFIIRYKGDYYLTTSNLRMIGSDMISFSVVSDEEERGHDKQIFTTDLIPFTSLEGDFKESYSVVEAYDTLDNWYDSLDCYYTLPDVSCDNGVCRERKK